uniref:Uncharacterized protein n=1 Tax=Candidatus Kentrum sp. MB TaxID=2138164 RepID=A0A450X328_9GAMM|nr:MAG: hypothetical protein BECKMB1821G_GA0114241_100574 [Candidatus Kentron sp. MB]
MHQKGLRQSLAGFFPLSFADEADLPDMSFNLTMMRRNFITPENIKIPGFFAVLETACFCHLEAKDL